MNEVATSLAVLSVLSGVVAFMLTLLVLQGGRYTPERMTFTIFAGGMAAWALFVGLFLLTDDVALARWYVTLYYISAAVLIYGLLVFAMAYASKRRKGSNVRVRQSLLRWVLLLPILEIIVSVIMPGGLIESIDIGGSRYVGLNHSTYLIYCFIFVSYAVIAVSYLIGTIRSRDKIQRQNRLIAWVICLCLPIASFTNLFLPLFANYSFIAVGPILVLPVVLVFFYAIIRHSLFDVRLAVVRSVAYSLILATMVGVYFGIAFLLSGVLQTVFLSPTQLLVSVLIALLLTLLFQPIKRFFDRLTNKLFYRYDYDSDDFFARLNQKLSSSSELRELLVQASDEIGQTMQAEQSFMFVWYGDERHMSAGSKGHARLRLVDVEMLDNYTQQAGDTVIETLLLPQDNLLTRMLERHKIAVILPLLVNGNVLGYAFLGERRSGNYTQRDIRVLETTADTLLIAVQNMLSIQEIRELNETLQQRIDDATKELRQSNAQLQRLDAAKDEFVSMASHQLRTPLTSVKGYISMVLEGDAGEISDMQRHLLSESFASSERMVHLINDFLNVSRLQTGKFMLDRRPVDLAKVTAQEVDSLKTTAHARNLKIRYRKPSVFPVLYVDEGKLRQVIMNFIDNAIYYSEEHSTITVELAVLEGSVVLKVHNEGIGVPESEQSHLFTKFFRATNARKQRPDGTGVGLFLSKKVVTAHGGSMVFESAKDAGTTFGFRLPIKKLSDAPADSAD